MKDFMDFTISWRKNFTGLVLQHNRRKDLRLDVILKKSSGDPENFPATIRQVFKAWAKKYREKTLKPLNPGQRDFYEMLVKFHKEEGRAPSYQEQCDLMGWKSKGTAHYFVHKLIDMGWLWADHHGIMVPIDVSPPEMIDER